MTQTSQAKCLTFQTSNKMETTHTSTHALCLIFLLLATRVSTQPLPPGSPNSSCSTDPAATCDTYVAYVAQPPEFTDLTSVSKLFGVARASIAQASNLASEDAALFPGQLLLVPLQCACNGTHYFANVTHTVEPGETYFLISTRSFESLVDWHVAVDTNPALKPIFLHAGDKLVIPLFCGCPSKNGIRYLITYVWQSGDDVVRVSAKFNASEADIIAVNEYRNLSAAAGSPVLIPVARLPALSQPYPHHRRRENRRWIVVATVSSASALLVSVLAILLVHALGLCQKRKSIGHKGSSLESNELGETENFEARAKLGKLLPGLSGYLGKPIMYDIQTIMEGTKNLSEKCKIGGSVYKAMVDGKFLAVKKAKENFTEELKILQKVNHANLVNLLGMSFDSDGACFLVYELAENGSLDAWLRARERSRALSWGRRLRVALDVAHGLQYMHEHMQPSVAHRGIRARNVLLDAALKAKIAGFSRAGPAEAVSELKGDVFGFGAVLLELLSGRATEGELGPLLEEVGEVLGSEERERERRVREWIDPKLEGFFHVEGALSLMGLAKACTQERELSRPSMGEIVFSLSVLAQTFCETPLEGDELVQISSSPITAR